MDFSLLRRPSAATGSIHPTRRAPARRWRRLAVLLLAAAACGGDGGPQEEVDPLLYPSRLDEQAPNRYQVLLETSEGDVRIEVVRAWAPEGADRFYNLVKHGFYDDQRIYRAVDGFMAQWGIHGTPLVDYQWRDESIPDDPVRQSNQRGTITFAKAGPDTRTTEVFINFTDNPGLDDQNFAPFGRVVAGMEVVDAFHTGYGDGPPRGEGPYAAQAQAQGNAYLDTEFPELTVLRRASLVEPPAS